MRLFCLHLHSTINHDCTSEDSSFMARNAVMQWYCQIVASPQFAPSILVCTMKHGHECCLSIKTQRVAHAYSTSVLWCLETPCIDAGTMSVLRQNI